MAGSKSISRTAALPFRAFGGQQVLAHDLGVHSTGGRDGNSTHRGTVEFGPPLTLAS
jgi:hypothetical protein